MTNFDNRDPYHVKDDVDTEDSAHHHTIGPGRNQAARGSDLVALEARVASIEARLAAAGIP